MKLKSVLLAAIGLLAAQSCAIAGSTIDPTQPPQNGKLLSPPVRNNFVAAYNDINNLLGDFAGSIAPASPTVGQRWRKTSVTPNIVYQWTGVAWVQVSTFDITGGTVTPYFGNQLLAWQQLIPGLGLNGQCLIFTGTSSSPTAQSCINSSNLIATAPLFATIGGSTATIGLNLDANFAVSANNLALAPIAAGGLIGNCGASSAEPTGCSWNSFANQAIGSTNGIFPVRYSGLWQTKTFGTSVNDPGTGAIENLLPPQTVTAASYGFATADLFKKTRRSNSGSAMSDTFPAAGSAGLVNGTRIVVANVDATATLTITAGAGTVMASGGSTDTVGPGRDVAYEYDAPATQWRRAFNTGTALLGPNNLSELSNFATARTNLGLAGIYSVGAVSHQWISSVSAGVPGLTQPNFSDLAGSIASGQIPNATVGYAQIQNVTAARLLGNPTGSAAAPAEISLDPTLGFSGTTVKCTTATGAQNGCVHPDGTTITVDGTGKIQAIGAAATAVDAAGATSITNASPSGCALYDNAGKVGCSGLAHVSVSNIAALRTLPVASLSAGQLISVGGYTAANDGGGGLFTVALSNVTDDGGCVINSTAGVASYTRTNCVQGGAISILYFGGKGDNSTDNTPAFNNMIAKLASGVGSAAPYGLCGFFPAGTYLFSTQPNDITFNMCLYGVNLGAVSIVRNYSPVGGTTGLFNLKSGSGGSWISQMGIYSAVGTSGGSLIQILATASYAPGFITLSDLDMSTFGSNTHTYTLYVNGSAKTTAPAGVRDLQMRNVQIFGCAATDACAQFISTIGLSWHGGGVFSAGGTGTGTGIVLIGGTAGVPSQYHNISVEVVNGGLNITNASNIIMNMGQVGATSGLSIANASSASFVSIHSPQVFGTVQTNWSSSNVGP